MIAVLKLEILDGGQNNLSQLDWNQGLHLIGAHLPHAGNPYSDAIMQYQATAASQPNKPRRCHTLQPIVIFLPLYHPLPPIVPSRVELELYSCASHSGGTCPGLFTRLRTCAQYVLFCSAVLQWTDCPILKYIILLVSNNYSKMIAIAPIIRIMTGFFKYSLLLSQIKTHRQAVRFKIRDSSHILCSLDQLVSYQSYQYEVIPVSFYLWAVNANSF